MHRRKHEAVDVAALVALNIAFIATTAPAFWGKADLELLLYRNGAYEELCTQEDRPICAEQTLAISKAFSMAIASLKLTGIFLGPLIDFTGPKFTGVFGQLLFGVGILFMADNWVLTGYMFMGASMNPIFNSTLSVCNLVPRSRNLVMSLLSSGGDMAKWTFMFVRLIHDATNQRYSVRALLRCYASVSLVQAALAILVFPRSGFTVSQSPQYNPDQQQTKLTDAEKQSLLVKEVADPQPSCKLSQRHVRDYHDLPLKRQLSTPHIWVFAAMFCIAYLKKVYFNDVLTFSLKTMLNADDASVSSMVTCFSVIQGFAFIWAWLFGFLADHCGVPMVLLIINTIGILHSVLGLFPSYTLQRFSFLVFSMYKSYTISSAYSFVSNTYGYAHLGTLTGILQVIAGFFVLGNIKFQRFVVQNGRAGVITANTLFVIVGVATTLVPVFLFFFPTAPPQIRGHAAERHESVLSRRPTLRMTHGCCAGPLFTELDTPECERCGCLDCCCDDLYCISRDCHESTQKTSVDVRWGGIGRLSAATAPRSHQSNSM